MRLAIFGGTFDPVHKAHLAVAREAIRACALDRILLVPAAIPPHKHRPDCATYEDRYRMLELACAGEPGLEPSRLEERNAKSYSIHTIERVRAKLTPADSLFFIIGADAFAEIDTWYRWRDVAAAVEFIVVDRPGHQYKAPPGARVHRLQTLNLPTSSSEIRKRIARGEEPGELAPAVMGYIRDKRLYRSTGVHAPA